MNIKVPDQWYIGAIVNMSDRLHTLQGGCEYHAITNLDAMGCPRCRTLARALLIETGLPLPADIVLAVR